MSAERNFTDQDYENLSAYLDGTLTSDERAAFESRLRNDEGLRQELDALRQTVNLVRALPPLKAPRNFTLTPGMVRLPSTRWLIFPTSATFSAVSAAAATLLILLGAGLLLLQTNSAGAPNAEMQTASQREETTAQIAFAATQLEEPSSQKTAAGETATVEEAAVTLNSAASPPPPPVAESSAITLGTDTTGTQEQEGNFVQQPAPNTADGLYYATPSEVLLNGQSSELPVAAIPLDSTTAFNATVVPSTFLPFSSEAADTGIAPGDDQQQTGTGNAAPSAGAAVMSDQIAAAPSTTAQATENRDAFGFMTATAPAFGQSAASAPVGTPTPMSSPTTLPTLTSTSTPTATATSTPAPTATTLAPREAPAPNPVQFVPGDWMTWGILILGVLLLVVAIGTTIVRRRG